MAQLKGSWSERVWPSTRGLPIFLDPWQLSHCSDRFRCPQHLGFVRFPPRLPQKQASCGLLLYLGVSGILLPKLQIRHFGRWRTRCILHMLRWGTPQHVNSRKSEAARIWGFFKARLVALVENYSHGGGEDGSCCATARCELKTSILTQLEN